jgi:hypothetical protein
MKRVQINFFFHSYYPVVSACENLSRFPTDNNKTKDGKDTKQSSMDILPNILAGVL